MYKGSIGNEKVDFKVSWEARQHTTKDSEIYEGLRNVQNRRPLLSELNAYA